MRILVTLKPKMYRETIALTLHQYRPDAEVMLGPSESLDGDAEDFDPHLLVRNADDGPYPEMLAGVLCRIEILLGDRMGASISMAGRVWEIEDLDVEDLLRVLDEVERLIQGDTPG